MCSGNRMSLLQSETENFQWPKHKMNVDFESKTLSVSVASGIGFLK